MTQVLKIAFGSLQTPVTKNLATALPIRYRIQFKISIFTYKALHGLATAYIIIFLDTI